MWSAWGSCNRMAICSCCFVRAFILHSQIEGILVFPSKSVRNKNLMEESRARKQETLKEPVIRLNVYK